MRDRFFETPQQLMQAARLHQYPREKMQVPKRQTRFTYDLGPMYFLGQQIVKAMQDAGYPAKILYCHRSADEQRALYAKGRTAPGDIVTQARPWESPHQYYEAVDIIHPSLAWDVSEDYWEALASCVRIVAERYDALLVHGHEWRFRDSAHIEMADWRFQQAEHRERVMLEGKERPPNEAELWARFKSVLPKEAARVERDARAPQTVDVWAWVQSIIERLGLR